MNRFWTSDLHFNHTNIIKYCNRPFIDTKQMDAELIDTINNTTSTNDTLIHLGDFVFGCKEDYYINQISPIFINIKGNHDKNNKVSSVADLIITTLGQYQVSASHYPSITNSQNKLPIHICGHVHNLWKHYYDKNSKILNINVGIDVWDYQIISDQELINYIGNVKKELNV